MNGAETWLEANGRENGAEAATAGYKRPFDLAIVLVSLVLLFPVWLLLWIAIPMAIRLESRGNILYRQDRVGLHGRPFKILKFRTMRQGAEEGTGAVLEMDDDPRVTRVGRMLRHLHLDEMPQIINILRGDMSLVGPRPERAELIEAIEREVHGFSKRLQVKPGIAGLAQVHAGYNPRPIDKLRYDQLYIATMNPLLDLKLLIRSVLIAVVSCFSGKYYQRLRR